MNYKKELTEATNKLKARIDEIISEIGYDDISDKIMATYNLLDALDNPSVKKSISDTVEEIRKDVYKS